MSKSPNETTHHPMPLFTDAFPPVSGNTINGLGETEVRRPSPFFWHPPKRQTHGDLQTAVTDYHRQSDAIREHFNSEPPGGRGPAPIDKAENREERPALVWTEQIKSFALANEADDIRVTAMKPLYVYDGYELDDPWIIVIAVSMDHDDLKQAPASFDNPTAGVVVAKEYNRASRVSRKLANFIMSKGHYAKAWPGPYASSLSMMPAALDAGMGQLGKHGSLIHRELGSSFRLAAVTTDLPLVTDQSEDFGAEDFCINCQICTRGCPPGAIQNDKQMVRGVEKWYVDFDKCIPYFGETLGCGICLAVCPWSTPGKAPNLAEKMLRRRERIG